MVKTLQIQRVFLFAALAVMLCFGIAANAFAGQREDQLFAAIEAGNAAKVRQLLSEGADVNARDNNQNTPLHYAASVGATSIARLLIEKGADVNARNINQDTPLHEAAIIGKTAIARLLIEKGADVNARDNKQDTPLHEAAKDGYAKTVRLLIEKGADINARDEYQDTPLYLAAGNDQTEVIKLLAGKGDYVYHDLAVLLREARTNFARLRGTEKYKYSNDKTVVYGLNPVSSIENLNCSPGSGCGVTDHFAENGQAEYWEVHLTLPRPSWAASYYSAYRSNIVRVLGPLIPGYKVHTEDMGEGLFNVELYNKQETVSFQGFVTGSIDLALYHNEVGKNMHTYFRPKPLSPTQLQALGNDISSLVLKGIRHAPDDFEGYHPALADRRYGKSYYNVAFVSLPHIRSCDINFDQGINKYFNMYGPAAPQSWNITCSSKSYENQPTELLDAVAGQIESSLPPGFVRSAEDQGNIRWKDSQANIEVEISALKNRPESSHPHRSYINVSVIHIDP